MANPFKTQNNGQKQSQNINPNQLIGLMKKINNPNAIKQLIMKQNPQMAQMIHDIESSGMHPIQYLTQQAIMQNINIDPQQIEAMYNDLAKQFN